MKTQVPPGPTAPCYAMELRPRSHGTPRRDPLLWSREPLDARPASDRRRRRGGGAGKGNVRDLADLAMEIVDLPIKNGDF